MPEKICVLLADDHVVVRMGLATLIGLEDDLDVVGQAADGMAAVSLFKTLKPDVVVMDMMMPKLDGAKATKEILDFDRSAKVLVLTTFGESDEVREALSAGAVGALVKDSDESALLTAVRAAYRGKKTISEEIGRVLKNDKSRPALTKRHKEILQLVAKGFTNSEISERVGIGADCVKAHLKTLFARLGVANRSEAAAMAVSENLI